MKKLPADTIEYRIVPKDLAGHLFEITLRIPKPAPKGQTLSLPAWIPGSYMIREFARNIIRMEAKSGRQKVKLKKLTKDTWKAQPCSAPLTVTYEVYAWDLSVRSAHLDQTHAFFNGTSVFLRVHGFENRPHKVNIAKPPMKECKNWRIATTLPELGAKRYGFGTYFATDYDELIDHPVEMGDFHLSTFSAHGAIHEVAVTGKVPNFDADRLCEDLMKICEAQIELFEPKTKQAPFSRYVFLVTAVDNGYGGLEHRASTALLCSRGELPIKNKPDMHDGYRNFLGLCSHEYFHSWNVKRIKPAVFVPYDLQTENYTTLLWLFEGFTSYYDDLILARSGIITIPSYLRLLERTFANVMRGTGRLKQTLAESSFDAWIKYYRQDENAPNAIVSYYTKGALTAMYLDLLIRKKTQNKKSLDDVMRTLWTQYGKNFYESKKPHGITEAEAEKLIQDASGIELKQFFDTAIRGTADLNFAAILKDFGITLRDERKKTPSLDITFTRDADEARLAQVFEGGCAHNAGLSANDAIVAIDGIRVTRSNFDLLMSRYAVGNTVIVHAFRRDLLMKFNVTLKETRIPRFTLMQKISSQAQKTAQELWLGVKN